LKVTSTHMLVASFILAPRFSATFQRGAMRILLEAKACFSSGGETLKEYVYSITHARLCKVCRSSLADVIDYLHYDRGLSYHGIIARYPEPNLNLTNLTNHFSGEGSDEASAFWRSLARSTDEEKLDAVRRFYHHQECSKE
jgi:hypothetical protein